MRVLVTGANGFVGAGLVQALLLRPDALGAPISDLILADLTKGRAPGRWLCGDLDDPAYGDALTQAPVDVVFHLASIPGAMAERRPDLGLASNLLAPVRLAQRLAVQATPARLVFASSIAVLGTLGPEPVTEARVPRPEMTYGAHKWMTEILLADHARRGEIDAISLRLPGIVARPPTDSGHGSAFMSQIFHKAGAAKPYVCPVTPDATAWWMSRATCVANLLHAATLPASAMPPTRALQMPVLFARVGAVLAALGARFGTESIRQIRCEPDARIEQLFGRLPPLETPFALRVGFVADGDLDALITHALT